jgi:hypothetical protein
MVIVDSPPFTILMQRSASLQKEWLRFLFFPPAQALETANREQLQVSDQAAANGINGRLGAAAHANFGENFAYMRFDRLLFEM